MPRRTQGRPPTEGRPAENPNLLWQLMPILIIALFSLLSYLPAMMGPTEPSYAFSPDYRHRELRTTSLGKDVNYWVNKNEWDNNDYVNGRVQTSVSSGASFRSQKKTSGLRQFETKIDNSYRSLLYSQCSNFRDYQEQRIDRTKGFFGIGADREAEIRIRNEDTESCRVLKDKWKLSVPLRA